MKNKTELKPCPFCGGEGTVCVTPWDFEKHRPKDNYKYLIVCGECLAHTDDYDTRELAEKAWNRRD